MSRAMDFPEQDVGVGDGDGLPSYENLAQAHGPNSRFGRWKSWIEKRAAERYADITPEELERRRRRGWGDGIQDDDVPQDGPSTAGPSFAIPAPHSHTDFDSLPSPPIQPDELLEYDPSRPMVGESLRPAHLAFHQLGSRFLPHTTSPIRALLPLLGDRLLLIGHDDGLSVLNMFPQEWTDVGLRTRGPGEAEAHSIWTGEGSFGFKTFISVFQMSLLEVEEIGESTPQGVVLFLVGSDPDNGKEQEHTRTLRMYNLASLISLARWAVSQKGARPLNLHRPPSWHPHQSTTKKHRHRHRHSGHLTKGLRSLMSDSPQDPEPSSSYQSILQVSPGVPRRAEYKRPQQRLPVMDSGWDIVDDLPLRWATDYVPLAVPGSRLMNASVLTYALWRNDNQPRGSALLAVAIKSAILLYESPKGERAFRFVKEYYTPLHSRGITFVSQNLQDNLSRSASDATAISRPTSNNSQLRGSRYSMRQRPTSLTTIILNPLLSLFVVFEKKVGLIRLINSSVSEIAIFEEPAAHSSRDSFASSSSLSPTALTSPSKRRSRSSLDGFGMAKDNRGAWTLPAKFDLPTPTAASSTSMAPRDPWDTAAATRPSSKSAATASRTSAPRDDASAAASAAAATTTAPAAHDGVYLVTRGKQSFVLPCPLPANMQAVIPLHTFSWRSPPTFVVPRTIDVDHGGCGGAGVAGACSESSLASCEVASSSTPTPTPTSTSTFPASARRTVRVLQLTAFGGEDGLEIQETPLSSLVVVGRERGSRAEEPSSSSSSSPVVAEVDIGDTGFLCGGGHWHRPYDAPLDLSRSYSTHSAVSFDSMATAEVVARLESDQGIYGWQRKGLEDWRVFWVGGIGEEQRTNDDD
ncbi:hypothetical protein F5148DRAFT_1317751 [Russula earlei]|uniref:Uncharacterized protein n=1 Tax=Russula earlei TaxID=71964 RepID=A0ACC0UPL3_9AGAM|nr:hypothetical protein F5148DRAFT_1317751 [Russula earlei]